MPGQLCSRFIPELRFRSVIALNRTTFPEVSVLECRMNERALWTVGKVAWTAALLAIGGPTDAASN